MTIPKIIHQIWVGPKDPPMNWINTWKDIGFEHILWDEDKLTSLEMINQSKFDYFMENKIYYGAADIARLEILNNVGGIYIDADTERLKNFPEDWLDYDFFAVQGHNKEGKWNYRVTNGVIGATKNNNVIKKYIDKITVAKKIMPCWKTIGGSMLTTVLDDFKTDPTVKILPAYTFYPNSSWGYIDPRANEAIAKHRWGSTKGLYK